MGQKGKTKKGKVARKKPYDYKKEKWWKKVHKKVESTPYFWLY